jgi:putative IMPACT (imprinted ancient) family translation regulator
VVPGRAHHAARHHCSAWIVGADRGLQRSSDDGEPSGTAGAPMLAVLHGRAPGPAGEALSDVAAVVVRWFGGVLLGAGGLVRAYSDAVSAALDEAPLVVRERVLLRRVGVEHAAAGRLEHELRRTDAVVRGVEHAADGATLVVGVTPEGDATLMAWLDARGLRATDGGVDHVDRPLRR